MIVYLCLLIEISGHKKIDNTSLLKKPKNLNQTHVVSRTKDLVNFPTRIKGPACSQL